MVPSGWEVKTLKDLGVCLTGLTYKPENVVSEGLLVLRSSNVQNSQLSFSNNVYVNIEIPEKSRTRYGDILLCIRNGSKRLIGKSAFITRNAEGFAHGAFMGLFRPKNNPEYIFQVFQTDEFYRQVHRNLGATINSINSSDLYEFKFLFPPAPEQQKIAKILTTWDKAINTTERLIENSRQQKKALMQQLLTGKKRFPEFDDNWEKVIFGDIVKLSSKKYNPSKSDKAFPCIELEHIEQETGRIIGTANSQDLSSIKNHYRKGDVLFGKLRPYLRKYARPDFEGVCSTEIWVFKTSDKILNEYLYQFIQTNIFISEANKSAGSKMPRADWSLVSELVLKLPPLEEQQKIAAVLTNTDKEIELLEQQLTDLRQEKKALMQQLLTGKKRVLV